MAMHSCIREDKESENEEDSIYEKNGFGVTGEKKPEEGTSEYLVLLRKE